MKSVPLKTGVTITVNGQKVTTSYREMIETCVMTPPAGGVQIAEVRRRSRVLDALDAMGDKTELHLEDADHACLMECIKAMNWASADRAILAFADDMEGVKADA